MSFSVNSEDNKKTFVPEMDILKVKRRKIVMNLHLIIGRFFLCLCSVLLIVVSLGTTGCAVYSNGMTLPNPYYMKNRVQFFPHGTEFPFPNEAATMQESQHDTF